MSNSSSTTIRSAASPSSIAALGELSASLKKLAKNMPNWQTSQAAGIRIKRGILWKKRVRMKSQTKIWLKLAKKETNY
ncbi:MAG: hypothetical protein AB1861_15710 [Cyanobacteriota bacterium]